MSGPAQPPRAGPYGPDLLTPSIPVSRRERAGASADLHPFASDGPNHFAEGFARAQALTLAAIDDVAADTRSAAAVAVLVDLRWRVRMLVVR